MELHIHIHNHNEQDVIDKLNQIVNNTNAIIMTNAEAKAALDAQAEQITKIKTEIQKLIDMVNDQEEVSPEIAAGITNVQSALQGLDDMNADA